MEIRKMARENETPTMMEDEEEEEQNNCLSMYVDSSGSVESHRLYLGRRTALEMLRDRGYGISLLDIDQNLPEFRAKYGQNPDLDQLNISAVLLRDPSKKIIVVFCGTAPIKKPVLRDISKQYAHENLSRMVLVLQSSMTTQSREAMRHLFPFKVETFQITELLINITKHALMPNHERLSAEEKQKLLKKYNIEDTQVDDITYILPLGVDNIINLLMLRVDGTCYLIFRPSAVYYITVFSFTFLALYNR